MGVRSAELELKGLRAACQRSLDDYYLAPDSAIAYYQQVSAALEAGSGPPFVLAKSVSD